MTETILISLAVILRISSNPLANVFQKKLTSNHHHPLIINFLTYLLLSIVCIGLALFTSWNQLTTQFWFFSLLVGLFGALGNEFLVKALKNGELSVLGPINSYKSVIGLIFGIFLLGEIPTTWGILGIILIIFGSYFVLDTSKESFIKALFTRKEIQLRLLAMLFTAIEAVFIKRVILLSSPVIAFYSWCWFGAVFSFVLLFVFQLQPKSELKKTHFSLPAQLSFLVGCIGIMQYTTNYVFANMPVGYALSLFQLSAIVSIFLGHKIFNEKDIRRKLIGSTIMIAGSIVIILLK